jgi:beta-glucosidase
VQYSDGSDLQAAVALATAADYAIVFVATLSEEGSDRKSLSLDDGADHHGQNALISAVAKANKKTIVVASVPGAVLMPWSPEVSAILTNFMPGQQGGNAIADVLFGVVNPSAKLPLTFPNVENETQLSPAQYPGLPDPNNPAYAYYTEKLLFGYRYFDAHQIQFSTGFPFGHGLSYTSFEYSSLAIAGDASEGWAVEFDVKNSGNISGAEVAQLYLGFPAAAGEPPLQLKGFTKTSILQPGQTARMKVQLRTREVSTWNVDAHAWAVVNGDFDVMVGSSSRDIRLKGKFSVRDAKDVIVL